MTDVRDEPWPQPAVAPEGSAVVAPGGREIRLIASDIDGTILSYDSTETGVVSARTAEAFLAAREAGLQVVLVTGRPVRWLRGISERLGTLGTVICSNGAVTYDLAEDRLVREDVLSSEVLFTAKDLILDIDPGASFAAETLQRLHLERPFAKGSLFFDDQRRRAAGITEDELRVGPLDETLERDSLGAVRTPEDVVAEELAAEGGSHPPREVHAADRVVKLLAKTETMDADRFLETVRERAGHLLTVTHSAPGVSLLELSAKGVNKAAALHRHAAAYGIPAEQAAAFGDMPNDVEMLQWAGVSWAVGSAHPAARSAATYVTGRCEDDGVAEVIENLLSGRHR